VEDDLQADRRQSVTILCRLDEIGELECPAVVWEASR
jgi:hypothetical protein